MNWLGTLATICLYTWPAALAFGAYACIRAAVSIRRERRAAVAAAKRRHPSGQVDARTLVEDLIIAHAVREALREQEEERMVEEFRAELEDWR